MPNLLFKNSRPERSHLFETSTLIHFIVVLGNMSHMELENWEERHIILRLVPCWEQEPPYLSKSVNYSPQCTPILNFTPLAAWDLANY